MVVLSFEQISSFQSLAPNINDWPSPCQIRTQVSHPWINPSSATGSIILMPDIFVSGTQRANYIMNIITTRKKKMALHLNQTLNVAQILDTLVIQTPLLNVNLPVVQHTVIPKPSHWQAFSGLNRRGRPKVCETILCTFTTLLFPLDIIVCPVVSYENHIFSIHSSSKKYYLAQRQWFCECSCHLKNPSATMQECEFLP